MKYANVLHRVKNYHGMLLSTTVIYHFQIYDTPMGYIFTCPYTSWCVN